MSEGGHEQGTNKTTHEQNNDHKKKRAKTCSIASMVDFRATKYNRRY